MECKDTLLVAGVAVAVAAVGGLGWKTLKARKAKKAAATVFVSPAVTEPAIKPVDEAVEKRKAELRAKLGVAPKAMTAPIATPMPVKESEPTVELPQDEVKLNVEHNVMSVSRMRVVEISKPQYKVPEVQEAVAVPTAVVEEVVEPEVVAVAEAEPVDVAAPLFWDHFLRNIRRPDVLALEMSDFDARPMDLPRGYHRATLCGTIEGILHVTKGNISFVHYTGDNLFAGISSAANRFAGKGLQNLTAKQAKDFLNGR